MHQRHWGLFGISALLAVHAFVTGHVLESSFFVVAYCWGWVAVCAASGRLEDIKAMALTMLGLLALSAAMLMFLPAGQHNLVPFYSLAFFPSVVTWACLFIYVQHVQHVQRGGEDAVRDSTPVQGSRGNARRHLAHAENVSFSEFANSLLQGSELSLGDGVADDAVAVAPQFAVKQRGTQDAKHAA